MHGRRCLLFILPGVACAWLVGITIWLNARSALAHPIAGSWDHAFGKDVRLVIHADGTFQQIVKGKPALSGTWRSQKVFGDDGYVFRESGGTEHIVAPFQLKKDVTSLTSCDFDWNIERPSGRPKWLTDWLTQFEQSARP